jgi:hypothetical protein
MTNQALKQAPYLRQERSQRRRTPCIEVATPATPNAT